MDIYGRGRPKQHRDENELLEYVRTYVSCMSCPEPWQTRIKRHFGSWTKALEAAGVAGNPGGKLVPDRECTLYLLDFGDFKKIGITQQNLRYRFAGAPSYVVLDELVTDLDNAVFFEKQIKKNIVPIRNTPGWFERNGKTECFVSDATCLLDLV